MPAASEVADATRFEGRDVERSLAALQRTAGGTFADDSFEVPTAGESPSRDGPGVAKTPGVTLPRWAIYAVALALPVVAVVAFLCGCLWASTGRW